MGMLKLVYLFLTVVTLASAKLRDKWIRDCRLYADDYETILQSECFVDKSMLIKTFMTLEQPNPLILVTAPRRFGKTVNMNMIKTFLKIDHGRKIPHRLTDGCNLFKAYDLNIYKYDNYTFFNSHCGRYPVIHLDLAFVEGKNFDKITESYKYAVYKCFSEHRYLRMFKEMDITGTKYFRLFTEGNKYKYTTELHAIKGLHHLSRLLYQYFSIKPIVLIDNYDSVVWRTMNASFIMGQGLATVNYYSQVMATFFNNNEYIGRALMNARVRLSGKFDPNNIIHFPFLTEHPMLEYYGLTSQEVRDKVKHLHVKHKYEVIEDYYGGYKEQRSGINLFSAWSLINYMQTEVLRQHWVDKDDWVDFRNIFHRGTVQGLVTRILELGNITIQKVTTLSYQDLITLRDILVKRVTHHWNSAEKFIHLLLDNGYFTPIAADSSTVRVKIPNEELHHHLFDSVTYKFYNKTYFQINPVHTYNVLVAIEWLGIDENITLPLTHFRENIKNILQQIKMLDSEIAFQCLMYTVLSRSRTLNFTQKDVLLNFKHNLIKEEGMSRRRVDIMTTRKKDGAGIVIEMMRNRGSAEEALAQIVNVVLPNYELFDSDDYKNKVKEGRVYIGLHLNTDTSVVTACCLVNESEMHLKICV